MLPVALLYAPGPRLRDENPLHRWAPELPQSNKLDCSLGYLKVFSDFFQVVGHGPEDTQTSEKVWKQIRQLSNSSLLDKIRIVTVLLLSRLFKVGKVESPLDKTYALPCPRPSSPTDSLSMYKLCQDMNGFGLRRVLWKERHQSRRKMA
jgi:hypothetical protein